MSKTMTASKLIASAIATFEQAPMPDAVTRLAIRALVTRTARALSPAPADAAAAFARQMHTFPVAIHTDAANAQHYEVLAEFFGLVLGPQRKYSCCLYADPLTTLAEAEEASLRETARRAGLADGQNILELGCGWGSLSLWMARTYPNARITSVSNSHSQRAFIMARAQEAGYSNLDVVTADANTFDTTVRFNRAISIEMFEHMSNWHPLLKRINGWLEHDGRCFIHIFTHTVSPYRFDHADKSDWIAQHFFTGGIMPSEDLMAAFGDVMRIEQQWRWSGSHYQRTAEDWLANFDANSSEIMKLFEAFYGAQARVWHRRWRLFFMATAGLFGHDGGKVWGVSHYLLSPVR